jgi:hypothetical protein
MAQLSARSENHPDAMSERGAMLAARRLSDGERAPLWRARVRLRETASRSLVLIPSIYLGGAMALGVLLPAADRTFGGNLLGLDGAGAQSILEAVAAGMIAFAGLVGLSRCWSCSSAPVSTRRASCRSSGGMR